MKFPEFGTLHAVIKASDMNLKVPDPEHAGEGKGGIEHA